MGVNWIQPEPPHLAMSFSMVCGVQKNTRLLSQNARRVPCSSFAV
jgi:hypothetical protein